MQLMGDTYEIRVKDHLSRDWFEWFEGLAITDQPNGESLLAGPIKDQAALFGILMKIRDLGLILISVNRVDSNPDVMD